MSTLAVIVATSAFAAQLSISSVRPLNPTPYATTLANGNGNENVQSYSLTVSSGQVSGVSVTVYCQPRVSPPGLTVAVQFTLTSGATASYGPVNQGSACNSRQTATVSVPVSPSVSLSTIASVQVTYS